MMDALHVISTYLISKLSCVCVCVWQDTLSLRWLGHLSRHTRKLGQCVKLCRIHCDCVMSLLLVFFFFFNPFSNCHCCVYLIYVSMLLYYCVHSENDFLRGTEIDLASSLVLSRDEWTRKIYECQLRFQLRKDEIRRILCELFRGIITSTK